MKTNTSLLLRGALWLCGLLIFAAGTVHAQDIFGSGANAFSIDFVTIGNPGNPDDTGTSGLYHTNHGGVAYEYRMGTYEISRDMILKANAASGNLNITLFDMTSLGGNGADRPATGVSWNEAARFVNWLNTSSGHSEAYKFATQPGDVGYSANENIVLWSISDEGYDPNNLYRNANAHYFLPSEDEWYKAAYYSGSGSTYYDYALGNDSIPGAVSSGTTSGTAVYSQGFFAGPADIDNAGGLSPYGAMGMNGNVWEWNESAWDGVNNLTNKSRNLRSGVWRGSESDLRSSFRTNFDPTEGLSLLGFRVASVVVIPEPGALVLAALCLAACGLGLWRRPTRRR